MNIQNDKYDLAVIGAGPAGMMAAWRASECGARVV
ncbi:MAG TPA: FAD-binding protein, partial [Nitrospirae bacterium]|nr:FAD-binding protein [Nitrospirota bacterium]